MSSVSMSKRVAWALGGLMGIFLVARGVAGLFVIDYSDPASYAADWGGPHLLGVLAVHSGPGLLILVSALVVLRRRLRARRSPAAKTTPHDR